MKIALVQQNYHIGNFDGNLDKIISGIRRARNDGAELVIFSELAVCGYPPRDFLEFEDFISQCYEAIESIKKESKNIGVIVGGPARNPVKEGKDLFNAAWLLADGEVLGSAHKTCLPNYDVFDEYRYFEPAYDWKVIPFRGKKIALTICEDIWNLGDNPLYRICPMDKLLEQGPDFMVNISASPFDYDHDEDRKEIIRANVLKYKLPMYYCNAIGSQTEIVFDGGSLVYDRFGNLIREMKYFEEDYVFIDLEKESLAVDGWPLTESKTNSLNESLNEPKSASKSLSKIAGTRETGEQVSYPETKSVIGQRSIINGIMVANQPSFNKEMRVSKNNDPEKIIDYLTENRNVSQIRQALILGIRDYFVKMGFSKAILGSSGGIDSAVTLTLATESLGRENVRAILMPSSFSSSHSVDDAVKLSLSLGNPYDVIPIHEIYDAFTNTLKPVFLGLPFGLAEENMQSRTRGNLLMSLANKFGYILLNTSNKSELSTGYGTLYGDMAGGLSVLGDVYKMQVYALARLINNEKEIIPQSIIDKAPSAELRPDQKDSDSLPEYNLLDKVLYLYIERRLGPKEIVSMGVNEELVRRVLKLVNINEYKRNQFCPIIRVSCKAFGMGRRVPIVGKYLA
jgi:NAD+ synthase (glutamine-hydrolysing)